MSKEFKAGDLAWYTGNEFPPRGVQMVVIRGESWDGLLTSITLVNSGETFDVEQVYLFHTKDEAKAYVDQEQHKAGRAKYSWVVTAERVKLDSEKG